MAEQCGFFDAHVVGNEYDRVYLAEQFARYFASFIGNGVFGGQSGELQVVQGENLGMKIEVKSGQGWINGYWYENTNNLSLPITVADGVLNRIDLVVLRWGKVERNMWLAIKRGTPAATAAAPTLQRDSEYYEIKLAEVSIRAGALDIYQSDITDTRLDSSVCGLVQGIIKQFDTTYFGYQINAFITRYIANAETDYEERYLASLDDLKDKALEAYNDFIAYLKTLKLQGEQAMQDYLIWLGNLKTSTTTELNDVLAQLRGLIADDVAANLASRITELEAMKPTVQVANITHNLGEYAHCDVYDYDYGAGVQTAGEGPAGGGSLKSIQSLQYEMTDKNHIKIKTKAGYGTVESVNKIDERTYVVVFADQLISLIVVLR